ncbi:plakophilin-1-like [Conger conger]|uniref:plakophilin-1-like n=1 Tax=Conger conger TaxID=82655 RepID=UPI002A59AF3B|nr:plakophilin-1-like [Conger conger]
MTTEPLRSALSMKYVEETSLAVPSDTRLKSGQQRVLDQVQSIKRKSKHVKSGSTPPTSPPNTGFKEFRWLKYSTAGDGSVFSKGISNGATSVKKPVNSQQSFQSNGNYTMKMGAGSVGRRTVSTSSQWQKRFLSMGARPVTQPVVHTNGLKPSRSNPELAAKATLEQRSFSNMQPQVNQYSDYGVNGGTLYGANTGTMYGAKSGTVYSANNGNVYAANNSGPVYAAKSGAVYTANNSGAVYAANSGPVCYFPAPSNPVSNYPAFSSVSMTESKMSAPKVKGFFAGATVDGATSHPDITMTEAVQYLLSQDENYQHCGASFIQHSTFNAEKAKQQVLQLGGIPSLVGLLHSPSAQVRQTAAAALRNLVFKNNPNKEEVGRSGGIAEAAALLRDTNVSETEKQLTGLLWNLSSAESLRPEMVKTALPVLTESVLVPFTGSGEKSANINMDPEVFYNATGCLRNLACGKKGNRKAIRNTRGLIDSLVHYVQSCVNADRPDEKSVENCVCVLHNLTYQLETEAPNHFSKITALAGGGTPTRASAQPPSSPPPIGCFSPQSSKVPQETTFDYPVLEDSNPKGAGWLFHSKAMQAYLSLLSDSESDATKEACVGSLQNLTANKGIVSSVMSQAIVQKLNGLQHIAPLVQSSNPSIQRTAVALVGNLTRTPRLQKSMARQILPQLVAFLSSGGRNDVESDDAMATACQAVGNLLVADPELGKKHLNNSFINSLNDLSRNSFFPKSSKAAALLLYGLWAEKNLQTYLKKQGMNKGSFVNDITTAVHKSVLVD